MDKKQSFMISIDEKGQVVIPQKFFKSLGLAPGSQVLVETKPDGLFLHCPTSQLARVYIEPTNQCNLNCRTCIRNVWNEPAGQMNVQTFERIISGINEISPTPSVFFGGYGEPLHHPNIIEMVTRASAIGARVELITNGILLTEEISQQLIDAGLNMLWVSLDGAKPESYADVRISEAFEKIIQNIVNFRLLRGMDSKANPEIGIAFVAMKRNIADLPALIRMSTQLGASQYMVTNVLPHTPEMCHETLYDQIVSQYPTTPSHWLPHVNMPRIEINDATYDSIYKTLRADYNMSINGIYMNQSLNHCPFIGKDATAIRWNGDLSPCLPLMHDHNSFLDGRPRTVKHFTIGNINEQSLLNLWNEKNYADFRARVQQFDFSPCYTCGGCNLSETNENDCYGNEFPTCGGCLWAQGLIQCP